MSYLKNLESKYGLTLDDIMSGEKADFSGGVALKHKKLGELVSRSVAEEFGNDLFVVIKELAKEKNDLDVKLKNQESELLSLKNTISEQDGYLKEYSELTKRANSSEAVLKELEQTIKSFVDNTEKDKNIITSLKSELEELKISSDKSFELKALEQKLEKAESDNEVLTHRVDEMHNAFNTLNDDVEHILTDFSIKVEKLNEEYNEFMSQFNEGSDTDTDADADDDVDADADDRY